MPQHPLHDKVFLFPLAAITNHHVEKTQINYLTILEVTSLKCFHRAAFLLEVLEGNLSLAFPPSRGPPHPLAYDPSPPSSEPAAKHLHISL